MKKTYKLYCAVVAVLWMMGCGGSSSATQRNQSNSNSEINQTTQYESNATQNNTAIQESNQTTQAKQDNPIQKEINSSNETNISIQDESNNSNVQTNLPVKLPIKSPFYGECLKFSVRKPSKPPILGLISDYYILFSL